MFLQTSSRDEMEERTDLGLVKGHAYGVTAVKKVSIGGTGLASFFRFFVQENFGCTSNNISLIISEEKRSCTS